MMGISTRGIVADAVVEEEDTMDEVAEEEEDVAVGEAEGEEEVEEEGEVAEEGETAEVHWFL